MTRIGIIAEDNSDVDVLRSIIAKMAKRKFGVEKFVGNGCGKVRSKCNAWSRDLKERGCTVLILVHDLDTGNLGQLNADLAAALSPCQIKLYIVVIPVKEIEAWLLADHEAIKKAMKISQSVSQVGNPESISRPKERLRDLIYIRSGHKIRYINSIHNVKIANACKVANLRRCASFQPLENFLKAHVR